MELNTIRSRLARLEDTICISLFERSQFRLNNSMYVQDPKSGLPCSFFEYLFRETEMLHGRAGRYEHAEEHPFFITPVKPQLERASHPKTGIDVNRQIMDSYMRLIRLLCKDGDDKEHGSATLCDIACLQALSRRVHMGEQVAEAKYSDAKEIYSTAGKDSIRQMLRDASVEEEILKRIYSKAERYCLPPDVIVDFFCNDIIPLTIDVEARYIMQKQG